MEVMEVVEMICQKSLPTNGMRHAPNVRYCQDPTEVEELNKLSHRYSSRVLFRSLNLSWTIWL